MNRHKILVTGGCGFIGTQVVFSLFEKGHDITIVDRKAHNIFKDIDVIESDYIEYLEYNDTKFDTIIHLAADHLVEQSVTTPAKYYANNVVKTKLLLDIMTERGINNIIFSSTGAVYGNQGKLGALNEVGFHYAPENPYASSKVACEMMIKDYSKAYGLKHVIFRYFNAAGADPYGRHGYVQRPATHVIPILCNKIIKEETFKIFGYDYSTPDGTCVRDYVHVADIANAHIKALELLDSKKHSDIFNLGGGAKGTSVRELVDQASEVVGKSAVAELCPRRAGDVPMLVADISKAEEILRWEPRYTLKEAIKHAWDWENSLETSK